MFIRELPNRSGSTGVQIVSNYHGKYKVVKTIGSSKDAHELKVLLHQARHELNLIKRQPSLFVSEEDAEYEGVLKTLKNKQIRIVGPEFIFGNIYDQLGYCELEEELLRDLVIARLAYPGSKLKTIDYLFRFRGIKISKDTIYRFLDMLNSKLKSRIEDITYNYSKRILGGTISIVFYDMTTLHFEASDEDDFRKTGFSKTGKHNEPQIYYGLLVGLGGYPLGFEIFEGNISEGKTIIPVLQNFEKRFGVIKPIVVADAGLLSNKNLEGLSQVGYQYIIGGRIKNESEQLKKEFFSEKLSDGAWREIQKTSDVKIIISYSEKRAKKDGHNRKKGLTRLEKNKLKGKFTKKHINNKGYNKYLKLIGEMKIEIDYEKYHEDAKWDGLKGYVTNTKLKGDQVIENYKNLWHIEKAFRISKTDLKIRPIYHRIKDRIVAHLCIALMAYTIHKEIERRLKINKTTFSVNDVSLLTHTMYGLIYTLPESKVQKKLTLEMDEDQERLMEICG